MIGHVSKLFELLVECPVHSACNSVQQRSNDTVQVEGGGGRARDDGEHLCDWHFPILLVPYFIPSSILLAPIFAEKIDLSLSHSVPKIIERKIDIHHWC